MFSCNVFIRMDFFALNETPTGFLQDSIDRKFQSSKSSGFDWIRSLQDGKSTGATGLNEPV